MYTVLGPHNLCGKLVASIFVAAAMLLFQNEFVSENSGYSFGSPSSQMLLHIERVLLNNPITNLYSIQDRYGGW
jgi:hypothetical protein